MENGDHTIENLLEVNADKHVEFICSADICQVPLMWKSQS